MNKKRLTFIAVLALLLDEMSFLGRKGKNGASIMDKIKDEVDEINKSYSVQIPTIAKSAAYFTMKNGELVSWDVVGSSFNHCLVIWNDENCSIKNSTITKIAQIDKLIQEAGKNSHILALLPGIIAPPPGVGTAIGLVVSIAFSLYNKFTTKPDYSVENTELLQAFNLALILPLELHLILFEENLLIDMSSECHNIILQAKLQIERELDNIKERIKAKPSERIVIGDFNSSQRLFNQMLNDIIVERGGNFNKVNAEKLEALTQLVQAGTVFEKVDNFASITTDQSIDLELMIERYKLIEASEIVGTKMIEAEDGLYTFLIPVTDKDVSYKIESLARNNDLSSVWVGPGVDLAMRAIPFRENYYSTSESTMVDKGLVGKVTVTTKFWGGLSTIKSKVLNLPHTGNMEKLDKVASDGVITVGSLSNADKVIYGDNLLTVPVMIQSFYPFNVTKTDKQGYYVGIDEEAKKDLQFLAEIPMIGFQWLLKTILLADGKSVKETADICRGISIEKISMNYWRYRSEHPFDIEYSVSYVCDRNFINLGRPLVRIPMYLIVDNYKGYDFKGWKEVVTGYLARLPVDDKFDLWWFTEGMCVASGSYNPYGGALDSKAVKNRVYVKSDGMVWKEQTVVDVT